MFLTAPWETPQRDTCCETVAGRQGPRSSQLRPRLAEGAFPREFEMPPSEPSWAKVWGPAPASAAREGALLLSVVHEDSL